MSEIQFAGLSATRRRRARSDWVKAAGQDLRASILESVSRALRERDPFPHLRLRRLLPSPILQALVALPFPPLFLEDGSGRRDLHNERRIYFDHAVMSAHPVAAAVAEAFQHQDVVASLADAVEAPLHGTCLRVEYALDVDGFWLEPHTDLGVKALSLLIPLPAGRRQSDLGTDLYHSPSA